MSIKYHNLSLLLSNSIAEITINLGYVTGPIALSIYVNLFNRVLLNAHSSNTPTHVYFQQKAPAIWFVLKL